MKAPIWLASIFLVACTPAPQDGSQEAAEKNARSVPKRSNFALARRGFRTQLTRQVKDEVPLARPSEELFSLVHYPTSIGDMAAYLSHAPDSASRHPAIIWITGGIPPGGIDSSAWEPAPRRNDQSAKAYREAGIVMMYPTFRGSHGNPGYQESFLGEVDDVIAAAKYLSDVDYVDPERIYLGGHSTGGTLALLVSAASDRFRAVFAFGPAANPGFYGPGVLTYAPSVQRESRLRRPDLWLDCIRRPTFVIEGAGGNNIAALMLARRKASPLLQVVLLPDGDHFDVLAPLNEFIALRINETSADEEFRMTESELQIAFEDR